MIPRSMSASALKVSSQCLRRFVAEYVDRGRGFDNDAASMGTACHAALEEYVKAVYIDKTHQPGIDFLIECLKRAYEKVFNSVNYKTTEFADCSDMLRNWYKRSDCWSQFTIVSQETKDTFEIELSDGAKIPLNYIMDVVILNEWGQPEVVDFKTNRYQKGNDELREDIQARIYALVMQIKYPDEKGIWVRFDFLRGEPTTVYFTRQDSVDTWDMLNEEVGRVLAMSEEDARKTPRLNPECNFCVVKTTCPILTKNVKAGGVMSMDDTQLVDTKALVDLQLKALTAAKKELDTVLAARIEKLGEEGIGLEGTEHIAVTVTRGIRTPNPSLIIDAGIIDAEVVNEYVSPPKMTVKAFEELLADPRVEADQVEAARQSITKTYSTPSVTLKKKG